jgi:hypothetical protein
MHEDVRGRTEVIDKQQICAGLFSYRLFFIALKL